MMLAILLSILPLAPQSTGHSFDDTTWTLVGDRPFLAVPFAGTTRWLTGFDVGPGDAVVVTRPDLDGDGRLDVTVAIAGPDGTVAHHVRMSDGMPPMLDVGAAPDLIDIVGDRDNFGFGLGSVPCAFFDNSEPEDVGVFDKEESAFTSKSWNHDLSEFPPPPVTPGGVMIQVAIREAFSDPLSSSTLTIETIPPTPFTFAGTDCTGGCICAFGTVHVFTAVLDPLVDLGDQNVAVTLTETDDNIALDLSRLMLTVL